MRIRLNTFVEEIIRRVDHVVVRENRPLEAVPYSMRWLIVARKLVEVGTAVKSVDRDGVELWRPSNNLEAKMGNSDVATACDVEVDQDFSQARDIMRYVAAVNKWAESVLESDAEKTANDIAAFNQGFLKVAGRDKNGFRRWEQTARGRKHDPIW
jgi:hypothetical protein